MIVWPAENVIMMRSREELVGTLGTQGNSKPETRNLFLWELPMSGILTKYNENLTTDFTDGFTESSHELHEFFSGYVAFLAPLCALFQ